MIRELNCIYKVWFHRPIGLLSLQSVDRTKPSIWEYTLQSRESISINGALDSNLKIQYWWICNRSNRCNKTDV